jgi:thiol:disulfide interchange protein DsbD
VSCKEMEHFTFSEPRVKTQLDGMLLLQVDVTANSAEHKALLNTLLAVRSAGDHLLRRAGREIKGLRVIGYQNAERFLKTLSPRDNALAASSAK